MGSDAAATATSVTSADAGPAGSAPADAAAATAAKKAIAIVNGHESHLRSFLKAVSWRTTGTIDTFVLSFIITGSVKFAGTIAGTEVATKIVLYYCHERIWAIIPWGRKRPDASEAARAA